LHAQSTSSYPNKTLEAASCLAMALWIRLAGNSDSFRISPRLPPVCNVTPTILAALHALLSSCSLSQKHDSAHAHLFLWILHTAAQAEQAQTQLDGDGYFMTALSTQIQHMRVGAWEACQKILQGFLFTESVQPHGEKWFEKVRGLQGGLHCS